MNRAPRDRRDSKRPGSFERRGSQLVRALNPRKAARVRTNRRLWRENAMVRKEV